MLVVEARGSADLPDCVETLEGAGFVVDVALDVQHAREMCAAEQTAANFAAIVEAQQGSAQQRDALAEAHLELARLELEAEDAAAAATALRRFLELEPHGERSTWAREKLSEMSSN